MKVETKTFSSRTKFHIQFHSSVSVQENFYLQNRIFEDIWHFTRKLFGWLSGFVWLIPAHVTEIWWKKDKTVQEVGGSLAGVRWFQLSFFLRSVPRENPVASVSVLLVVCVCVCVCVHICVTFQFNKLFKTKKGDSFAFRSVAEFMDI